MVVDHGAEEEVRTIIVGGFPVDSAVRELDNLCRFMPGFEGTKVNAKKGLTLFAMFDCADNAQAAVTLLNMQPYDRSLPEETMKAAMAKSNMRLGDAAVPGVVAYQQPAAHQQPAWGQVAAWPAPQPVPVVVSGKAASFGSWGGGGYGSAPSQEARAPPQKRPWTATTAGPGDVDTITCPSSDQEGLDVVTLESFFSSLRGFVLFKAANKGQCFAKYETPRLAVQAVNQAHQQGLPAEMARSSMKVPGQEQASGAPVAPALAWTPAPAWTPPPAWPAQKRPRPADHAGEVDTVAHVHAADAGFDAQSLHQVASTLRGFVAFKANPRMGGGFSKFASPELAEQAIAAFGAQGVPAEWAKSSMSAV